MPLPPAVSALVTHRLSAVEAALPGFVTALRVTGSAASGTGGRTAATSTSCAPPTGSRRWPYGRRR